MSTYVNMPDVPAQVANTGIQLNAVANYQVTDVDNANAINKV